MKEIPLKIHLGFHTKCYIQAKHADEDTIPPI